MDGVWPLWLFWWAWNLTSGLWRGVLVGFPDRSTGLFALLLHAWPTFALLGPFGVMAIGIGLYRAQLGSRAMAYAGVVGMAATALLTGWPEYQRLWPYVGAANAPPSVLLHAFDPSLLFAIVAGLAGAGFGLGSIASRRPLGGAASPRLLRARSDNFGHADWLSMAEAKKLFPGPDPAYGGLVVGEAYRVDEDSRGARSAFDPADRRSWGMGGRAPLLIDPCRSGPTHALIFAGAGGFKTTSAGVPTLLAWTGSAVVLDPSREIGPMVGSRGSLYRRVR